MTKIEDAQALGPLALSSTDLLGVVNEAKGLTMLMTTLSLDDALERYWNAAYAEGQRGATHDTAGADAQVALVAIKACMTSLVHKSTQDYAAAMELFRLTRESRDELAAKLSRLQQTAEQVLTDMCAQDVLTEWQTELALALGKDA